MTGADNQQERLDARWIAGFVDGEGCFHVAINKLDKMTRGYQVLPELRIVQNKRDMRLLHRIQQVLGGVVRHNHDDIYEVRVRRLEELQRVVDFFRRYPLQSQKRHDFSCFAEIVGMMARRQHLTVEGLEKIRNIRDRMNRASGILRDCTPNLRKGDDTVRTVRRLAEA
ncbi:hypothetical protein AUJ68_04645 [Candidatus Woesearchaeota archaeon CG1_02_57_44]|nr:MAG: hypothetical protein AUJ68_04645 [Candidatus Woesearchaeota archaeon CG1_02_57_44]